MIIKMYEKLVYWLCSNDNQFRQLDHRPWYK